MPTLNDLLRMVLERGADSLQLRSDHVPVLFVGRQPHPVPAPAMTAEALARLVEQILTPVQRMALDRHGRVEGEYRSGRVGIFDLRARRLPEGLAVGFRPRVGADEAGDRAVVRQEAEDPPTLSEAPATPEGERGWPTHSIAALLGAVIERRASDLVVSTGTEATVREAGEFRPVPGAVFDDAALLDTLSDVLTDDRRAELDIRGNVDTAFDLPAAGGRPAGRFRVNVFRQLGGLAAAFRPIWETVPSFDELNLPPAIAGLADFPYGLVLVTGPTGMGKSTTLSALVEHINATRSRHIITLEDPIEYLFRRKQSLIHQREVGVHVESFAAGLRAALREAPDVILVGEMRDQDTIASALTAAETGHLVLSTLHCGTPAQAIDRIIDVFPDYQQSQIRIQLADVLRAIVAQRLIPCTDGRSRVPAVEVVRVNHAFSNLIRERKTHLFTSQILSSRKDGTLPFDESLAALVRAGRVAIEEAMLVCRDRNHLETLLTPPDSQPSPPLKRRP